MQLATNTYFPLLSKLWNETYDRNKKFEDMRQNYSPSSNLQFKPLEVSNKTNIPEMDIYTPNAQMNAGNTVSGALNGIGSFMQSPMGGIATGAVGGSIGGFLGNQQIKSQNRAINNSINTMKGQLEEVKRQRQEAIGNRRGESADFLANYITARDPNRSSQIAQMYNVGQERFRSELAQNDANQLSVNNAIAQLQSQKQKEMSGWEIAGQGLLGAAQMLPFALMG